jgi:RNA polymerase sigma-70 factor (sigma-E family)
VAILERTRAERPLRSSGLLEKIFREHYGRLVGLARLLVDHHAEAEEVVQEAFARVYAAEVAFTNPGEATAYVQRAVVNLARDGIRRRVVARRAPAPAAGTAPAADHGALEDEDQREVAAAVRALPRRQRECVALRYLLDQSTADTAATLGISEGTVKSHLSRGLSALEQALEGTR